MSSDQERNASSVQYNNLIFFPHNHSYQSNYTKIRFQPIEHLPDLKLLSNGAQTTLFPVLSTSLLVGTYFRIILYRYFWRGRHDKNNNIKNRPINAMILLGAIIRHVTNLVLGANYGLLLGFGVHMGEYMGELYCNLAKFVGVFSIAYLIIGSMTIAILRVMYIKNSMGSKFFIDNKIVIGYTALLGSILLTLVMTILFTIKPSSERTGYNSCMSYPTTLLEVIYQYRGHTRVNYNTLLR
jgi:hypothetical protein